MGSYVIYKQTPQGLQQVDTFSHPGRGSIRAVCNAYVAKRPGKIPPAEYGQHRITFRRKVLGDEWQES